MSAQVSPAAAVAMWVVTKAFAASSFAPRALPALKPNQPNQRGAPPSTVNGRLWGRRGISVAEAPAQENAQDQGGDTGAYVDDDAPAKSSPPRLLIQPPVPHTQWASGS